ncbi:ActS/PrrB/RegB family redox-sensitive histidine kinase [Paracoccus pacificus]|uniref:histidine kinase n=1 Tax=Paracoccus pacificus TaxID=1463598 RepID=A0ABW4R6L1_9RHOB
MPHTLRDNDTANQVALYLPHSAEPIRLRTLVLLRWVALAGQLGAVVAALKLGLRFDFWPVVATIAAGALMNLSVTAYYASRRPAGRRLDSRGALAQLIFDVIQLSVLVGLTGGMSNPFAMLILAPVTIASTALSARQTAAIGAITLVAITLAAIFPQPVSTTQGIILRVPDLLAVAQWSAIGIGVVFFALYAHRVAGELAETTSALLVTQAALAREQRLQHLGGVVAAAAHEMGTPLATIKLVSSELADELAEALPDRSDLAEDAALLRESVTRCRDILRSMGSAGKQDLLLQTAALQTVVEEAARPHSDRGIAVDLDLGQNARLMVLRDPGLVHALRNLIQNAVDFAQTRVVISADAEPSRIGLTIHDDGAGYSAHLLGRLGDPFLTTRRTQDRGGYEGMGLGLFIARTLLERSGAAITFQNAEPPDTGAVVRIIWPRDRLVAESGRKAMGENPLVSA